MASLLGAFRSALPRPIDGVLDPWPVDEVLAELERRQAALVSSLEGTVLELAGPPGELPDLPSGDTGGAPQFDHMVTVGWFGAVDDLDARVAMAVDWLAPGGWLHIIEPSLGRGNVARAQRLAATVAQRRTGWRIDRDIPAAVRRSGLVITDLKRFSMPVSSVVLRPWVAGRARRRGPIPFDSAATTAGAAR